MKNYALDICNEAKTRNEDGNTYYQRQSELNCHYNNHLEPFLIIGPFPVEVRQRSPKLVIYHDFFTEKEMKWMIDYSTPLLTNARNLSTPRSTKQQNSGFVSKAIQTWFTDIVHQFDEMHAQKSTENASLEYDKYTPHEPYSYLVKNFLMLDISHRIELATKLNVTKWHSSTLYQTTYYGLAGMVNAHVDAYGYEKGRTLTKDIQHMAYSGDIIATFMGWLKEPSAGGHTVFPSTRTTLEPSKGSAAFWTNLSSCHYRDMLTKHAGCPVLKGSKWILNKWIYSFAQWNILPCHLTEYEDI